MYNLGIKYILFQVNKRNILPRGVQILHYARWLTLFLQQEVLQEMHSEYRPFWSLLAPQGTVLWRQNIYPPIECTLYFIRIASITEKFYIIFTFYLTLL